MANNNGKDKAKPKYEKPAPTKKISTNGNGQRTKLRQFGEEVKAMTRKGPI